MAPTLMVGDVVLVDTWEHSVQSGKVIVIKKHKRGITLAKRIANMRNTDGGKELFLEGDNSSRSVDSRRFGWIDQKNLIGEVKFVWFSFQEKRFFLKVE